MLNKTQENFESIVDTLSYVLEKLHNSLEEGNLDPFTHEQIGFDLMYVDELIDELKASSSNYEQYWEKAEQAIDDFGLDINDIKKIVLRINTGTIAHQVVHITI